MNKSEPLGLPAGTVRALLVLGLVVGCFVLYALRGDVPAFFERITEMGVGWYFITRGATAAVTAYRSRRDPNGPPEESAG